ncbi:hypothetical protein BC835DRAFT_1304163 [Cytidiella melzeri]|nr:hypothetical protein BC835DRAFT_1304163 [Cytidiella melzeri]
MFRSLACFATFILAPEPQTYKLTAILSLLFIMRSSAIVTLALLATVGPAVSVPVAPSVVSSDLDTPSDTFTMVTSGSNTVGDSGAMELAAGTTEFVKLLARQPSPVDDRGSILPLHNTPETQPTETQPPEYQPAGSQQPEHEYPPQHGHAQVQPPPQEQGQVRARPEEGNQRALEAYAKLRGHLMFLTGVLAGAVGKTAWDIFKANSAAPTLADVAMAPRDLRASQNPTDSLPSWDNWLQKSDSDGIN